MIRRFLPIALLAVLALAPPAAAQAPEDATIEDPAAVVWPEPPAPTVPPIVTGRAVAGVTARLRADGKAAVPIGAPKRVRRVIAAANEIVGKPYKWGGGHAKVFDRGYDCSGAVSYGLVRTGLLAYPLDSRLFMRYAAAGVGRWLTIYTSRGHAYMEVAGLRLDTSPISGFEHREGVRWREPIGKRPGFRARHLPGL